MTLAFAICLVTGALLVTSKINGTSVLESHEGVLNFEAGSGDLIIIDKEANLTAEGDQPFKLIQTNEEVWVDAVSTRARVDDVMGDFVLPAAPDNGMWIISEEVSWEIQTFSEGKVNIHLVNPLQDFKVTKEPTDDQKGSNVLIVLLLCAVLCLIPLLLLAATF